MSKFFSKVGTGYVLFSKIKKYFIESCVSDPDQHGSALTWLSWIRIWNQDPDPGARKLSKINKCT